MTTEPLSVADADAALAERLERLKARRAAAGVAGPTSQPASSEPVEGAGPAAAPTKRRRRHAAKGARRGALALSLASTVGLTTWFAAADATTASAVSAAGGVVSGAQGTGAGSASTTVNGDVFTNKWGPVQVQATFAPDGTLVSVDAVQAPSRDGKSVRINQRAVPVLDGEALQSQSSGVDTVSGATYTSNDYRRSLQSAIDTARAQGITQLT